MKAEKMRCVLRLAPILAAVLLALPASGAGPKDIALPKRPAAVQADLVKTLENRTIGPSLGADSVRAGLTAGLIAIIAVTALLSLAAFLIIEHMLIPKLHR